MLSLYTGSDHKANRDAIFAAVFALSEQGTENVIVLVPEQYSFETQRELCRRGGDTISRHAEVLSLTYLAERVEAECGGGAHASLDRGGRLLAAARAVDAVQSELRLYAAVCRKPSFLSQLLTAIDEFGGYGVQPNDLRAMASAHEGQFAQKLTELCLLYESYLAVTSARQDAARRLARLRANLDESDFARDRTFFVYGFADFTVLERAVIEALARKTDVTIALETTYASAENELRRWRTFCAASGVKLREQSISPRATKPALARLARVFDGESTTEGQSDETVQTAVFSSQEQLVRAACRETRRLLTQGANAADIAVVCPDSSLTPLVRRTFEQAEIKLNDTEKCPLSRHNGAAPLLTALDAVTDRMDTLSVLACLRACAENQDEIDRLERYCLQWSIRGGMWEKPFTKHPQGLKREWSDDDRRVLAALEETRARTVAPLAALRRKLAAATVREDVVACYEFLQDVKLKSVLQSQANRLYDAGRYRESLEFVQIYDMLLDALEQTALVLGDGARKPEEFYRLMQTLLEAYSVGTIPASADAVTLGTVTNLRCASVRHLVIVGASDGAFPAAPHAVGVFTESERAALLSEGAQLAPLREFVAERELGAIRQMIRAATESVWLGATEKQASYLFRACARAFAPAEREEREIVLSENEKNAARLRRGETPDNEDMAALKAKATHRLGSLSPDAVSALYRRPFSFSATQIEQLAQCRFAYFLHYGLHLEKDKPTQFDAPAFGTFVHDVLEHTVRTIMDEGGFRNATDEHILSVAADFATQYETSLADFTEDDVTWAHHFANYLRETEAIVKNLAEELRQSQFEPAAEELAFKQGSAMPEVEVAGKTASCRINGKVDRVDLCKLGDTTYVRVVDYKTGQKDFDFADVAEGAGLQMLLYLFALKRGGEKVFGAPLTPAGVLYHPARDAIVSHASHPTAEEAAKESAKQKKRKGVIHSAPAVLHAMEEFDKSARFLPVYNSRGNLMDDRDFDLIEQFIFGKVGALCDMLASGAVAPNPLEHGPQHSPCTYCDFREYCCRESADFTPRNRRTMNRDAFMAKLIGEEDAP